MKLGRHLLVVFALCSGSVQSVLAEDTTWDFSGQLNYSGNNWGNSINMSQSGQNLTVSAWADNSRNAKVQNGVIANNQNGLLAYNRDDANWYEHTVDNVNNTDMLLFSFDQAVALTEINLGWGFDYSIGQADMSVAGFDSLPSLHGNTWSDVVSLATFSTSLANVPTGTSSLTNITNEARYWLVGAYNSVFGTSNGAGAGNDGFKLLALTTHSKQPAGEVNTPTTAVLVTSLLALVAYRRRGR